MAIEKLPRNFSKPCDESIVPLIGTGADDRHRVTGVNHLRKYDQLSACGVLGPSRKIANLQQICLGIAERTRNLGNCNFHFIVILIPQWREKNL
jgi:hypothetical protein